MKQLLQIVALMLMAVLAMPPALAESICSVASNQPSSMECCDVAHVSAMSTLPDVVQDCDEGCCSVAPQNAPGPIVPDKFKADSTGLDTPLEFVSLAAYFLPAVAPCAAVATRQAQDLPVLLHTFRI